MFPYIIDVALTAWVSSAIVNRYDYNGIAQYQNRRKKIMLLGLILFVWVLLFAFRGTTGGDASVYRYGYKHVFLNQLSLSDCFNEYRDKLYQVLVYFCGRFSQGSWVFMCFVTGILIYTPIIIVIAKKSDDYNMSCLLFIFLMCAYFPFNGTRQGLAISFAVLAYYLGLKDKKILRYALLMLVAYGFHASVLLIIPFHLLSLKKLKSISTFVLVIALFVVSFFLNNVWGNVIDAFSGDQVVSKYDNIFVESEGSSVIRVIFWLAPVVFALMNYSKYDEEIRKEMDSDILLTVFAAVFLLYSTQSVSFSQMAQYFTVSSVILIPRVIRYIHPEKKNITKYLILFFSFIYMLLILLRGSLNIIPYVPVWESGMY